MDKNRNGCGLELTQALLTQGQSIDHILEVMMQRNRCDHLDLFFFGCKLPSRVSNLIHGSQDLNPEAISFLAFRLNASTLEGHSRGRDLSRFSGMEMAPI